MTKVGIFDTGLFEGRGGPVALLIDAAHCPAGLLERVVEQARAVAPVSIARAYADWTRAELREAGRRLVRLGVEGRHHPAARGDDGAGDDAGMAGQGSAIALACDAMELLHTVKPRAIIVATRDADFTALAIKLRAGGCEVIGIGAGRAAADLVDACSHYVLLEEPAAPVSFAPAALLSEAAPTAPPARAPFTATPRGPLTAADKADSAAKAAIADWVVEWLAAHADEGPWHRLADLGKAAADDATLDYEPGGGRLWKIVRADRRFSVRTDAHNIILVSLVPARAGAAGE